MQEKDKLESGQQQGSDNVATRQQQGSTEGIHGKLRKTKGKNNPSCSKDRGLKRAHDSLQRA